MTHLDQVRLRPARRSDAQAIATLHVDSWRRHYRGAYSDDFLDGDVTTDRLAVWTDRFRTRRAEHCTIVAERDDIVVGFAHVILDDDPTWGALLDNLHVVRALKRHGIGTRLVAAAAAVVVEHTRSAGLYLWVLEQNTAAHAFYEALNGRCVGREVAAAPGGDPARLNGAPHKLRYAWPHPSELVRGTAGESSEAAEYR